MSPAWNLQRDSVAWLKSLALQDLINFAIHLAETRESLGNMNMGDIDEHGTVAAAKCRR
jgi:hypothetical protein